MSQERLQRLLLAQRKALGCLENCRLSVHNQDYFWPRKVIPFGAFACSLMLGLMIATAFLSMWISNSATTVMMMPIAQAVLLQLDEHLRTGQVLTAMEMTEDGASKDCLFLIVLSETQNAAKQRLSCKFPLLFENPRMDAQLRPIL